MRDFGLTDKSGMDSSLNQGPHRIGNPADPKAPIQIANASLPKELLACLTDLSERNGAFEKNTDLAVDGDIAPCQAAELAREFRAGANGPSPLVQTRAPLMYRAMPVSSVATCTKGGRLLAQHVWIRTRPNI